MKLEIVSSDRDHAILIGDEDHNDIAEFYHSDHATVSQSYEMALALAKQLVECHAGVSPMTAPMTSREALQDALDEWARANLPTESAGCITSWSDWIAAFVCDGVFGDSQMHPLSDIRDLDEVVRELGIQDSSTTPAEAVRELNAEIERLRSVAQAAASPDIFAIHAALATANIEYAAFSCNGFNLVGDSKSIKEAARAFHSHAQIDEFRTQIRHWREECGKLHAKLAASPVPSTDRGGK